MRRTHRRESCTFLVYSKRNLKYKSTIVLASLDPNQFASNPGKSEHQ